MGEVEEVQLLKEDMIFIPLMIIVGLLLTVQLNPLLIGL
jgi:hypothetical protein